METYVLSVMRVIVQRQMVLVYPIAYYPAKLVLMTTLILVSRAIMAPHFQAPDVL